MRGNRALHSRPLMPPTLENGRWRVEDTDLEKVAACFVLNLEGGAGERARGRAGACGRASAGAGAGRGSGGSGSRLEHRSNHMICAGKIR